MELTLYVFDSSITPLGAADTVTALTWGEKFSTAGTFELWCPLNERNITLLIEDNLVWPGFGESCGIIEFKENTVDEEGKSTIHIQGRLGESLLDYRTIYPTLAMTGRVSEILRAMVNNYLVNPTDPDRKIPLIELATDQQPLGPSTAYQKTGGTVLTETQSLCESNGMGFRLQFFPKQFKHVFRVYQGTDRTVEQALVDPVLFSSDLDDILTSKYSHNKSELRNFAYIAGEGEGAARKRQTVGIATGISRREIFVDARDLQSEKDDGTIIPEEEYNQMLKERGWTQLEDFKDIETFDATLRTFGGTGYVYGVDFFLGDLVTVYDARLRVKTNAVVSEAVRTFNEEGNTLDITFGYSQPTLANKLKRRQ